MPSAATGLAAPHTSHSRLLSGFSFINVHSGHVHDDDDDDDGGGDDGGDSGDRADDDSADTESVVVPPPAALPPSLFSSSKAQLTPFTTFGGVGLTGREGDGWCNRASASESCGWPPPKFWRRSLTFSGSGWPATALCSMTNQHMDGRPHPDLHEGVSHDWMENPRITLQFCIEICLKNKTVATSARRSRALPGGHPRPVPT